jgi:hypothetical protein
MWNDQEPHRFERFTEEEYEDVSPEPEKEEAEDVKLPLPLETIGLDRTGQISADDQIADDSSMSSDWSSSA